MVALVALIPFTFHWYPGEPPALPAFDVKVTWLPAQKGFDEAEIERVTVRIGFAIMVTGALVAGLPVTQLSDEVNWQVITSPFSGV